MEWFYEAAKQGLAVAQHSIGAFCATGRGVQQDYQQAEAWYRVAAEQGHAEAQYDIAELYKCGLGSRQDETAAEALGTVGTAVPSVPLPASAAPGSDEPEIDPGTPP